MAYQIVAQGGRLAYGVKFYRCDSTDDLKLLPRTTPGCKAFIGDRTYLLNSSLEWEDVSKSLLRFKGTVDSYSALQQISNPKVGDTYNDANTGMNYVYTENGWDSLGGQVFLSDLYYTKDDIDNKGYINLATAAGIVSTAQSAVQSVAKNYTDQQINNLATVAKTGDYNDLINIPTIPTIPTKLSDLQNDIFYQNGIYINKNLLTNKANTNDFVLNIGHIAEASDCIQIYENIYKGRQTGDLRCYTNINSANGSCFASLNSTGITTLENIDDYTITLSFRFNNFTTGAYNYAKNTNIVFCIDNCSIGYNHQEKCMFIGTNIWGQNNPNAVENFLSEILIYSPYLIQEGYYYNFQIRINQNEKTIIFFINDKSLILHNYDTYGINFINDHFIFYPSRSNLDVDDINIYQISSNNQTSQPIITGRKDNISTGIFGSNYWITDPNAYTMITDPTGPILWHSVIHNFIDLPLLSMVNINNETQDIDDGILSFNIPTKISDLSNDIYKLKLNDLQLNPMITISANKYLNITNSSVNVNAVGTNDTETHCYAALRFDPNLNDTSFTSFNNFNINMQIKYNSMLNTIENETNSVIEILFTTACISAGIDLYNQKIFISTSGGGWAGTSLYTDDVSDNITIIPNKIYNLSWTFENQILTFTCNGQSISKNIETNCDFAILYPKKCNFDLLQLSCITDNINKYFFVTGNNINSKLDITNLSQYEFKNNSSNINYEFHLPTNLSEFTNDSNYVQDSNYHHTDKNYTQAEETKLHNIETNAQVNKIENIKINNTSLIPINNKIGELNIVAGSLPITVIPSQTYTETIHWDPKVGAGYNNIHVYDPTTGQNPNKEYQVTMNIIYNQTINNPNEIYFRSQDDSGIYIMLGSGVCAGFNTTKSMLQIGTGGGGWNGNVSSIVFEKPMMLFPNIAYKFDFKIETNKITILVNNSIMATYNISTFSPNDYFIFYPKGVDINIVGFNFTYLDNSLSFNDHSRSTTLINNFKYYWPGGDASYINNTSAITTKQYVSLSI